MFNKQPLHLQTHRLQRPTQRGVVPSVAQYLQKVRTPEKEVVRKKESPSYRIKSNTKQSNSLNRQTSSQSPNREKTQVRNTSFHSHQMKQRRKTQEIEQQNIQRRQKTEQAHNESSPKKNALLESQEIMMRLQKNTAVRRVKTEECERVDLQNSIRATVQRKQNNNNNDRLLDLLLLSTVELKRHFEKPQTARQVVVPKVRIARLSIKQFPLDFFQ